MLFSKDKSYGSKAKDLNLMNSDYDGLEFPIKKITLSNLILSNLDICFKSI